MAGRLDGKAALITGASRGIGRAIALAYAREGAMVAITGVQDEVALEATRAEIAACGVDAMARLCDAADRQAMGELVGAVVARWGRLDIMVPNAGLIRPSLIEDIDEDQWDRTIAVHLKGTFNAIQAAIPPMRDQGGGKIITVAAPSALRGMFGVADYAAAKGGIIALTRNAASELKPDNIQVNCVSPVAETRMTDALFAFRGAHEAKHGAASRHANMITPEEVAPVFVFFASAESDCVSGQLLAVER